MPRQDPPRQPDEPDVRRWPRAWRVIFLLGAGAVAWILAVVIAGFVRRRIGF
ncbi:MAG: hypothetical protein ACXU82_07665 [Caulobacteraceae bacterium]